MQERIDVRSYTARTGVDRYFLSSSRTFVLLGIICILLFWSTNEGACSNLFSKPSEAVWTYSSGSMVAFPWQPITHNIILPQTYPIPVPPGNTLSLKACRGEYEPSSFILRALKTCKNIRITVTDLVGPNSAIISADAIDVRVVKCWYQAGANTHRQTGKRVLVPELLLHDDSLVKVDYKKKKNFLKIQLNGKEQYLDISSSDSVFPPGAEVKDSPFLKPFDLQKNTNKQIWITIKIPKKSPSGEYSGVIYIYHDYGAYPALQLKLIVTVLPFDLEPPLLEYSIYYRGKLTKKPTKQLGSEWKSPSQYEKELLDIKEHGIRYPTLYQRMDTKLKIALSIRCKVGLPKDRLYVLGLTSGNPRKRTDLAKLRLRVRRWVAKAVKFGYKSLYIYGMDEAKGEKLRSERQAWRTVHREGGKIFVACSKGAVDIVGDLLDVAVLHGKYKSDEVRKWHKYGKKVLIYSNPQGGVENPEIYRENYGLRLLKAGYDGAMLYAYQHGMGNIWNDFDHPNYRDLVFSYPTSDGVINTIQWEGLREGIDDVRYFSTLVKTASVMKTCLWILGGPCNGLKSLPHVREQIISEIIKSSQLR